MISFCKNDDVDDIVVPTYKMTLATLFGKDLENVKDVDAKCSDIGKGSAPEISGCACSVWA